MTDIMHMLQQAQAQAHQSQNQEPQQNNSVASFFNSLANSKQSTNPTQSVPIPAKSQHQGFTLESIERNIPKISPTLPPNHDTLTQNTGSHQNDLMANSPLAQFINSNNLNALRVAPEQPTVNGNSSLSSLPGFKSAPAQSKPPPPISNGLKETKETKLLTPNMLLTNGTSGEKKQQPPQPEPLSKNQLLQAFKYLIDNDNDFTKKIHDAYLKSVNNS